MEEKPILKIGDRVEQMCLTCGEERGHIIASMTKTGKITRVSCPKCGSRVPYKSGTTRRASNKVGAPYESTRTYRRGQTIMHPDDCSITRFEFRFRIGSTAPSLLVDKVESHHIEPARGQPIPNHSHEAAHLV